MPICWTHKMRLQFTSEMFSGKFGSLTIESGSVTVQGVSYTNLHYHGGGNMLFEIIGGSDKAIGATAFSDTLYIKAGTRVWMDAECLEFTEDLEWRYVGNTMRAGDGKSFQYEWVTTKNNIDISRANVTSMYNATDAGGEVRLKLTSGILTNDYYGFMAVDTHSGFHR